MSALRRAQIDSAASKAPAARWNAAVPQPPQQQRRQNGDREHQRAFMGEDEREQRRETSAIPPMPRARSGRRASAGQNTACAIHISVGKPNTSGQRQAVEAQAKPKTMRPLERSAANVAVSPSSGATKNKVRRPRCRRARPRSARRRSRPARGRRLDEQATGDIVPLECPGVADRDRIGKDRTIGVQLQLVYQPDHDEENRRSRSRRRRPRCATHRWRNRRRHR